MKNTVTVVPADNLIILDGEVLQFGFAKPEGVHAIQWMGEFGWIEYTDKRANKPADYNTDIAPYVALWEAEKERLALETQVLAEAETNKPISEKAKALSMPKLEFVEMAEALTAHMSNPVTWASINEWMQTNPEIQKLFILATEVKRNDPKLDEVTAMFGAEFLPFLDMMFVYKDEIQAEMTLAKEQSRPINLDALIPQEG